MQRSPLSRSSTAVFVTPFSTSPVHRIASPSQRTRDGNAEVCRFMTGEGPLVKGRWGLEWREGPEGPQDLGSEKARWVWAQGSKTQDKT